MKYYPNAYLTPFSLPIFSPTGVYFHIDLWNQFHGKRHAFCLGRSKYGDFDPSHHRHEMAVRVMKDIVWSAAALPY